MKNAFLKKISITALLLITAGYMATASAHDLTGSLGADAGATDFYSVACSDDGTGPPSYLVTGIQTSTAAATPRLSVQTQSGNTTTNSTDPTNGDSFYSPTALLTAGYGPYNVLVDKNGAGAQSYTLVYHCLTSNGDHTGTNIFGLQDQ